jgi:hypothetical protein
MVLDGDPEELDDQAESGNGDRQAAAPPGDPAVHSQR